MVLMVLMSHRDGRVRWWVMGGAHARVHAVHGTTASTWSSMATSMSHESLGREKRAAAGIFDTTLRISVGIENVDDLIDDLARGLAKI